MSASALSTVEAAIVEYYVKGVEDTTGNSATTYRKIKKGHAQELNSRSAAIVIQPQNNISERWSTSEFDDYPAPGRSPLVKLTVPFVNFYAAAGFSRHVLSEKMSSDAVADIVQTQMDNKVDHIDVLMNIVLWGDGTNERARVSATNTTTGVVTCDNSGNLYGSQLIEVGQEVEFRAADGTLRGTATGITWTVVTARSKANKTFTVQQCSSDVAAADRVYPRGGFNSAPRGFAYHVAPTGAWQGLSDRTVYDGTYVPVINNGGGVLGASIMDKANSEQFFQRGTSKTGRGQRLIYWNTQRDAYLQAGYDMKPQNSNTVDLSFTNIVHGGMREVPEDERDKHIQRDTVWFLNIDELMKFEMDKLGIIKNSGGGVFHQRNAMQGPGHSDGVHVYWGWIGNYGCKYPSKLGTRIYNNSVSGLAQGHV